MLYIKRLVIVLTIIWFAYFTVCYADILAHNLDENPQYNHGWNMVTTLWNRSPAQ